MSDVRLCVLVALKAMLLVQFLNLSNLLAETPDLFPENLEVIHTIRIIHLVEKCGFDFGRLPGAQNYCCPRESS